jgi:hypothetical protein
MKKIVLFFILTGGVFVTVQAQGLSGLLKKVTKKDTTQSSSSSSKSGGLSGILGALGGGGNDSLSTNDVANGLKEALSVGVNKGTSKLSAVDGFFKDAAIKILLPPEAQKVEKTLRSVGMGKLVDDAVLSMNRAAEDAAKSAAPIFLNAVKQITIKDAWSILRGSDTAATGYLRSKTLSPLTEAFRPSIEKSLSKVNATKYWNALFTAYNKMPFVSKINPDLSAYVTDKATSGIFYQVGQEEKEIRKNPLARTSDLLKKVFASK